MLGINIVTAVCLALLTAAVIYVIVSFAIKNREGRIAFIRGFKKGKCLAVFSVCLPLIGLAYWYANHDVWTAIFNSIQHVIGFVVMKFNLDDIAALLADNLFYRITVYYSCVLIVVNALLFTASLTCQRLWAWAQRIKIAGTKKDKLYIFGSNAESRAVYNSDASFCRVIVDKVKSADADKMYIKKIGYISERNFDKTIDGIFDCLKKRPNRITVVINTGDDERNLELGRIFAGRIRSADDAFRERLFDKLGVYVFGDPTFETLYDDIAASAYGCVHYKNKYRMLAMNFIDKYPLSAFMDERHIDYDSSLVRSEVNINVCMIGFGRPNRQIFLTSVANNQFITDRGNGAELKQVNYYVFDKEEADNNKNLNHSYYRFKNECAGVNESDYLPLPENPAKEEYLCMDINAKEFYNKIHDICVTGANAQPKQKNVNFIIVSFDSDLENIDMAQKLVEKRREWGLDEAVIFVRTKKMRGDHAFLKENNVIVFGDENESVYNIEQIMDDKISRMAKQRNEIYDLEYKLTHGEIEKVTADTVEANRRIAAKNWFIQKTRLERESNLYGCLSLRSKLNLMGLDCRKVSECAAPALSEDEYISRYAQNDLPDTRTYNVQADGKRVVNYTLDFAEGRRKNMAVLEHLRWNSFMISRGMIPASKAQILNEKVTENGKEKYSNGRNYRVRRHGNLTTFDGLVDFRKMIAKRDGKSEAECDVIKYDYQILDDAYWLLDKNGYKIIEKPCVNT